MGLAIPSLSDDNVVEGGVSFAEASEADFKYHHLLNLSMVETGTRRM